MRKLMRKYASNASMPQISNGTSGEQILDANSGHERVPQTSRTPSVAENDQPSHVVSHPTITARPILGTCPICTTTCDPSYSIYLNASFLPLQYFYQQKLQFSDLILGAGFEAGKRYHQISS
ncbi:hypothetical protein A4A49_41080 [Nicotiana attenuata]|uniref:Uncharacterized protein n=1 Tax=Nicotiana attenuata TaxID=49451 RepID=A0A1J6KBW3_NICAT|nr:hypothetical protein A4A49_41080 [Nicotiana attenuata]